MCVWVVLRVLDPDQHPLTSVAVDVPEVLIPELLKVLRDLVIGGTRTALLLRTTRVRERVASSVFHEHCIVVTLPLRANASTCSC